MHEEEKYLALSERCVVKIDFLQEIVLKAAKISQAFYLESRICNTSLDRAKYFEAYIKLGIV